MFQQHFYHEKIRKCVAVFGTMFNNLYVLRKDSSGAVISQLKVPLSYAPKQKFLERIRETENLSDEKLAVKLPRMSFEISPLYYDPVRQLPKVNSFSEQDDTGTTRKKFYTSVPYILNFQLNILSKTSEDGSTPTILLATFVVFTNNLTLVHIVTPTRVTLANQNPSGDVKPKHD